MTRRVVIVLLMGAGALPSCDPRTSGEKQFIETFIKWAAAPPAGKPEYEFPSVSLGSKPRLSESYSRAHLKNFRLQSKQICPLVKGSCSKVEDGFELKFDVEVSGIALPPGVVEFNRSGQIVRYEEGPRREISRVISREDALTRASARCNVKGLTVDPGAQPRFTSYRDGGAPDSGGVLSWMFSMTGEMPRNCFYAECAVDAVTGASELSWRCGGASG
jgi:hypothetical protein